MRNDGRSLNVHKSQGGWLAIAAAAFTVGSAILGGSKAKKGAKKQAAAQRRINAIKNQQARAQRAQEIRMAQATQLAAETSITGMRAGGTSARRGINASMMAQQARGDIQGAELQAQGEAYAAGQADINRGQNITQIGGAIGNMMGAVSTAVGPDSWLNKMPGGSTPIPGQSNGVWEGM